MEGYDLSEVGKGEITYFYSFIRSPVIAPGFLKLFQTSLQCYEDLVSHLNKKMIVWGLQPGGQGGQGGWQEEPHTPWAPFSPGVDVIAPVVS